MIVKHCESVGLSEKRTYISVDRPKDGLLSLHVHNNDLLTTDDVFRSFQLIINHIGFSVQSSLCITLEWG